MKPVNKMLFYAVRLNASNIMMFDHTIVILPYVLEGVMSIYT